MASRALTATFMITCWSCVASALTGQGLAGSVSTSMRMRSGMVRARISATSPTKRFRSRAQRSLPEPREKSRIDRTSLADRSVCSLMTRSASRAAGSLLGVAQQQLGVGEDRREQVVEVVGEAAGQLADHRQAVLLLEAARQLALAGGVVEEQDPGAFGAAGRRAHAQLDEARLAAAAVELEGQATFPGGEELLERERRPGA